MNIKALQVLGVFLMIFLLNVSLTEKAFSEPLYREILDTAH